MTATEFLRHIGETYFAEQLEKDNERPSALRLAKRRYEAYKQTYVETSLYQLVTKSALDRSNICAVWAAARDRDAGRAMVVCSELEG